MNHKIKISVKLHRSDAGLREIFYGTGPTPFGECFLAMSDNKICALVFVTADINTQQPHPANPVEALKKKWPEALIKEDPAMAKAVIKKIFYPAPEGRPETFDVFLRGTDFQLSVWKALLTIPEGRLVSYSDVAAAAGRPEAIRAAAGAVASNPVSYLIPCHRVILKNGSIHRYGGGVERKRAIIRQEAGSS